jgi:dipeptidyl aminopeptidase/acylaminoacyl peptidase
MSTNKQRLTAEDLYEIQVITDCQISPDGRFVVYGLQRVEKESEKKYTHLWVVPTSGGEPHQLTVGKQSDTHPVWSPDSRWIAFRSNREDEKQPQLFILPMSGGEARSLTKLNGDFASFDWSPDSRKIVFQFRKHDKEDIDIKSEEQKKKLGRVVREVKDRVFFKLDGYGYLPQERYHLWSVDVISGEITQLTDTENADETEPVWSPDGKEIAFFSNRTGDPDLHPGEVGLFLLNVNNGEIREVTVPVGPKAKASFSPDGKKIAYIGHEGLKASYKNDELWVVDLGQEDAFRSMTADADINVGGGVINDIGSVGISAPLWSADAQEIFFQVGQHGRTFLMKANLRTGKLDTVIRFEGVVSSPGLDSANQRIALIKGTMTDPGQICAYDLNSSHLQALTHINHALFDRIDLGTFEEVWFKGSDDNDLQGWIIFPPDFKPDTPNRSIMEIHGGPLTQYGFLFMHEFFFLAAQGYVVYFCNPRGGQGYGEEHARAIYYGKWGTVDYKDLMAWADYMESQAYIDRENMGVTGGSYGGYMTVWIIGHTDRFKAAVTQRCVSNLVSMWGSSDFNWSFQSIFDDKAPYENLDVLWQCSPIKHIGSARTPTLVIHSMQDLRCAIEQSEQVYVALKNLQVDTAFLMFPDSPHGLSRNGRTDRRIRRLDGILDWFNRYLEE